MNTTTMIKKLLIFLMSAVFLTFAHPASSVGSQEFERVYDDPKLTQLQNYFDYESPSFIQDNNSMDKLFFLYMYPELRDNILRKPESKRQVRYRQCYFNPISCFRK